MENATEALKLAAWVLLFVVALSLSINSFGEARQTMDAILEYNDREYYYDYVKEQEGSTERIVGFESIIPTIYRAYKENYKIIFPSDYVLYTKKNSEGEDEKINYIDLEKETIGNQKDAEDFIRIILFGETEEDNGKFVNIDFSNREKLYDKISTKKKYKEYLGEYYQEEAGNSEKLEGVADINKTKKRVITYEELN